MVRRALQWLLVAAFAATLGHLAWNAFAVPPLAPGYWVGGHVPALRGLRPEDKNLYLRRTIYLSQQSRRAWIEVVGRDGLELYVNGRHVETQNLPSFPVAIVADVAPSLVVGRNVIAIAAHQASLGFPPVVAVDGAYTQDDGEHALRSDGRWRGSAFAERRAHRWFESEFDDNHWPFAPETTVSLRCKVKDPPRAVTTASVARWITLLPSDGPMVAAYREFDVQGVPRQAWLRVTTTSPYRLALNGYVIDEQEDRLATAERALVGQRTYDLTPLAQPGRNVLAFVFTPSGMPAHLLADVEVEDEAGRLNQFGTGADWLTCSQLPGDVLNPGGADAVWRPCHVESGDLDIKPWQPRRQVMQVNLPMGFLLGRLLGQVGLTAAIALLTWLACEAAARLLTRWCRARNPSAVRSGAVYLALVPATVFGVTALLATYDPRFACQDVYQGRWVILAVASVPLQWLFLLVLGRARWSAWPSLAGQGLGRRALVGVLLLAIVGAGAWLRFRNLTSEPLQWDEITGYEHTRGVLARGFPSDDVSPNMPPVYTNTSELVYFFTAAARLVFDDPRYVMRFPAACWSVLTIALIYIMGQSLFRSELVGLVAAAIYAFSPVCIAMCNYARYFATLQFFTVLTVYLFWLTVAGRGPIAKRSLWLTALSFVATYLAWEGGALVAPGLIVAALFLRRGRIYTMLGNPSVWAALLVSGLAVILQFAHRYLQQTESIWYGVSASDATIEPMWPYAVFQPWYYLWESTWNQDALIPMLTFLGAGLLALRGPWRRAVRFLFLIHFTVCFVTAALLNLIAWRYIHHFTPLLVLLAAAVFVAAARRLVKLAKHALACPGWVVYARGVAGAALVVAIAVSCGMTLSLCEMDRLRTEGFATTHFRFANLSGPTEFLREHAAADDLIICHHPFMINHFLGYRRADYWLESILRLPATLDDTDSNLPRDRRDGTPMIPNLESLEAVFANAKGRIWFLSVTQTDPYANNKDVMDYVHERMDVVYEDFGATIMVADTNHRSAIQLKRDLQAESNSTGLFIPK